MDKKIVNYRYPYSYQPTHIFSPGNICPSSSHMTSFMEPHSHSMSTAIDQIRFIVLLGVIRMTCIEVRFIPFHSWTILSHYLIIFIQILPGLFFPLVSLFLLSAMMCIYDMTSSNVQVRIWLCASGLHLKRSQMP